MTYNRQNSASAWENAWDVSDMDIESAKAFKARLEAVVAELSAAVLIAEKTCSPDELQGVKRSVGHMIADVDELLHGSIYADHPELDDLGAQS